MTSDNPTSAIGIDPARGDDFTTFVAFEEQPDGSMRIVPRPPRCEAILRTGNDLDYQCEGLSGHEGRHRAWRFEWSGG